MSLPESAKEALKTHIRAHNTLAKRPRIPEEQAFSNIHDAPTTTAISWLKAYDEGGEKEKGKILFQIGIERVAVGGLGGRDVEDLAGGHYYLPSSEPLWIQPVDEGSSVVAAAAEGAGKVWKGVINGKIYIVKTVTGGASLALEWKLERQVLKSFRHENLVQLLFSMQQDDTVHMIFHPYSPTTLSRALDPRLSPIDLKTYPGWLENSFCCLLSGLRFLHSKNIKQLDLKPQHIVIDHSISPPNILFSDFGHSGRFSISTVPDPIGVDPGSWYDAPEQFGKRPANIFSLAIIFLEILVYMRMKAKNLSPREILSDPRALGHKGAGNIGERKTYEVVDLLVDGTAVWLVEVAGIIKSMLAYEYAKRPSAKLAHLKVVNIIVGDSAEELDCSEQTLDGSPESLEDGGGDEQKGGVEVRLGLFEQFLKETQKIVLTTESCASKCPQEGQDELNSHAPGQRSPLTSPNHIAWPDPSESAGTPKKRTLEDTEQGETDGEEGESEEEEEGGGRRAKRVKVYI